jgi:hypothetical protein
MSRSKGEEKFISQLEEFGFPTPEEEYKFLDSRRFRFDFAWPQVYIAVEIEGGTWVAGRHSRGAGFESDCVKYNFAARDGWRVYRFTTAMVKSREGIYFLVDAWPLRRSVIRPNDDEAMGREIRFAEKVERARKKT